jgi:hypothetical protein
MDATAGSIHSGGEPEMGNERWLKCIMSAGQFTGEYAARSETFTGEEFSLFVPEQFVDLENSLEEGRSVPGWVRVELLDQRENLVLVRLPNQTLGNGQSITVRREQLEARRARQEA